MKPWLAINARRLLEDRQKGILPGAPVSVVLTDDSQPAPALYVKDDMPIDRLDWRMLVNLEVWLWASPEVPMSRWMRVAKAIAAVRPLRLTLRFEVDGQVHDVDVGHGLHTDLPESPAVHEFTWTPMDLSLTPLGAQLRRELASALPKWSVL